MKEARLLSDQYVNMTEGERTDSYFPGHIQELIKVQDTVQALHLFKHTQLGICNMTLI